MVTQADPEESEEDDDDEDSTPTTRKGDNKHRYAIQQDGETCISPNGILVFAGMMSQSWMQTLMACSKVTYLTYLKTLSLAQRIRRKKRKK